MGEAKDDIDASVIKLFKSHPSVNMFATNNNGETPCHVAAAFKRNTAFFELFQLKEFDSTACDSYGVCILRVLYIYQQL